MKSTLPLFAAVSIFLIAATAARSETASGPPVDLALVLAVDASGSVNQTRFDLQKHGYALAFRDSKVIDAITAGESHAIAVAMVQWTGPRMQVPVVNWTRVSNAASGAALADAIDAVPRRLFGGGTSLSGAIDSGVAMLASIPFRATRRVIDVSGDGSNNSGRPADAARDDAVKAGIVINGLPIAWIEPNLAAYYRANVIGGPGSFLIAIDSYDDFADAIIKKLVTEIADMTPAQLASSPSR